MPDGDTPLFGLSHRLPPTNMQAEQALLGAIFCNNKAFDLCAGLEAEHFADPIHGFIFKESARLIGEGRSVSPVTLKALFEHNGVLNDVGGVKYLNELITAMVGIINAGDYARAIRDAWLRRQLIAVGEEAVNLAFGADTAIDGEAAVTATMDRLLALGEASGDKRGTDFSVASKAAFERSAASHRGDAGQSRLDTGIPGVDSLWAGLWPGQLYYLMARSRTGKTPCMMQIARHVAAQLKAEGEASKRAPGHVHVFSLEMTAEDLLTINLASTTRWTADQIRAGDIGGPADWLEFERASALLGTLPIVVDDCAEIDMATLSLRARVVKRRRNTRLICIDYRELVRRGRDQVRMGLPEWIPFLGYQFKALAKSLNVPVIALAQINKGRDGQDSTRPTLTDLPYDGGQAADAVFSLYRPELYMGDEPPKPAVTISADKQNQRDAEWRREKESTRGLAEFSALKRRFGPPGRINLRFDGPRMLLSKWRDTPDFDEHYGTSGANYG